MSSLTAAANLGWEVAGAKKNGGKKLSPNNNAKKMVNGVAAKQPKIENLAPLQLKSSIYDNLRESEDDSDNENNNKGKKQDARVASMMHLDPKVNTKPASPKPAKQSDSVNLLQANIANNKKKVSSPVPAKNVDAELERALGQLKIEEFEKEYGNLFSIFPNSPLLLTQHLATFLNQKLFSVPDIEPSANHENEQTNLVTKVDKKLIKFYNGVITKLNRADSETLFDFCFESLFNESAKSVSNHGYRIVIQLLVKHSYNLLLSSNLIKYANIINSNKHKPTRCLIAMWALGQFGYYNLLNGVRLWYECMLPFVNIKNCGNYVVSYLSAIFQHHTIDLKTIDKMPGELVSLEEYVRLYDFMNEKMVLSKDALNRLKSAFEIVRAWFILYSTRHATQQFEPLLATLPVESSTKQSEYLYVLAQVVLANNEREVFAVWRKVYAKYLQQSLVLLESLLEIKNIKSNKNLRETLRFFDEQTSSRLQSAGPVSQKESSNKPYYTRKSATTKTNEIELVRKLNELSKKLVSQQPKRTSPFKMAVRTFFFLLLATGVFFYWDVNQNKSVYTNTARKELDRYGLLKPLDNYVAHAQKSLIQARNTVYHYTPIYYKKASDTVGPVIKNASKVTREYLNLAWIKSEPYRDLVVLYLNEAIDYVHTNFPVLVKNLVSVCELAVNYFQTLANFVLHYTTQFLDFVGTQLLSMKKGELQKVFLDSFNYSYSYVAKQVQQLQNYMNQN